MSIITGAQALIEVREGEDVEMVGTRAALFVPPVMPVEMRLPAVHRAGRLRAVAGDSPAHPQSATEMGYLTDSGPGWRLALSRPGGHCG